MIRKLAIALVATAALGFAAIPTTASAQSHGHGGWHRGGGSHGWHGGWRHGGWRHGGWRHGGWRHSGWRHGGWRGHPYAYVPAPYYAGCYRTVRVATPWGVRWRRVWVCS